MLPRVHSGGDVVDGRSDAPLSSSKWVLPLPDEMRGLS